MRKRKKYVYVLALLPLLIGGMALLFFSFQSDEVKAVRIANERAGIDLEHFGEVVDFRYDKKAGMETYVSLQILIDGDKVDSAVEALENNIYQVDNGKRGGHVLFGQKYAVERLKKYDKITNYEKVIEGKKAKTVFVCISIVEDDGNTYFFYVG